jgi:hypothetical protein
MPLSVTKTDQEVKQKVIDWLTIGMIHSQVAQVQNLTLPSRAGAAVSCHIHFQSLPCHSLAAQLQLVLKILITLCYSLWKGTI